MIAWHNMAVCDACYERYKEKHRLEDKREYILQLGEGVINETEQDGDMEHYPEPHDEVKIMYELRIAGESEVIDSNARALRGAPLTFRAGASGPVLHCQILGAQRLFQTSVFDVPDPYVSVYWAEHLIGTTRVREDTRNPIWTYESFVIPLDWAQVQCFERAATKGHVRYPTDMSTAGVPLLRCEVFDYNTMVKDDYLGQAVLSEMQIVRVLAAGESEARVYPLQPRLAAGTMHVSASRAHVRSDATVKVIAVKVWKCVDLIAADALSESDPYLTTYFDEELIGQTPHQADESNPSWEDAVFIVDVTDPKDGRKLRASTSLQEMVQIIGPRELRIEVRDFDQLGAHKLLGEVRLSGATLAQLVRVSEVAAKKLPSAAKKKLDATPMMTCVRPEKVKVFDWRLFSPIHRALKYTKQERDRAAFGRRGEPRQDQRAALALVPQLKLPHFALPQEVPLVLSKAEDGHEKVAGTLSMRLIYHTRGTVLRGLDEGVQAMSLGERAVLNIRSDYGYDTCKPGPRIPENTTLEATVDLVAINKRSAWWVYHRRRMYVWYSKKTEVLELWWIDFETSHPWSACLLRLVFKLVYSLFLLFYKCLWRPILRPLLVCLLRVLCCWCYYRLRKHQAKLDRIRADRAAAKVTKLTVRQKRQIADLNTKPYGATDDDDDDDVPPFEPEEDLLDVDDTRTQADIDAEGRKRIQEGGSQQLFAGLGADRHVIATQLQETLATGLATRPLEAAKHAIDRHVHEASPVHYLDPPPEDRLVHLDETNNLLIRPRTTTTTTNNNNTLRLDDG